MKLADLAIAIYASESAMLRTLKAIQVSDREVDLKAQLAYAMGEEAAGDVHQGSTSLLSNLLKGEERAKVLGNIAGLLSSYQWEDTFERNRAIVM
ncbi:hypothetical protein MUO14_18890 [Halobacillus shinanisalinarum]|uniref:Acyl-CoA dehydrogenase-like C-terminal domain-containing protein n=1 Tax=Halobacillus shinanisalinarum TaxID=2932258 RepID=A0ABY4GX07_9BACI|nr:hypothetical protein [Halobacillus shinanisalinarum]UOQ92496.1 hypothetical protein MUO14_18890 [Halobacillus shinanisalinarum]